MTFNRYLNLKNISLINLPCCQSVGKKLAVVEVCVGRQEQATRSTELGEDTDNSNNNSQQQSYPPVKQDKYGKGHSIKVFLIDDWPTLIAEKSLLPSFPSDPSTEDISNLQLKGSSSVAAADISSPSPLPTSSHQAPVHPEPDQIRFYHPPLQEPAKTMPTKPILKNRSNSSSSNYDRHYSDKAGNWYTNPMDSASYYTNNANYNQVEGTQQ